MASGGCGGVLDVTGPKGTARVMVTDQCPECEPGHLDLSQDAFAKLGDLSAGIIPISYEAVADPPLPGPLAIRVKEGSSIWWTAFLVINHGNPLASVELKRPDGSWLALERTPYNQWLKQDGAGEAPYSLRITDLQGHRVVVNGIALEPTVVQTSGVFMYGTTSTPTTSTTRPTTTLPTTSSTRSTTSRTTKVRTKSKTTKAKTTKVKTSRSKTKTTKTRTTTRGVSGNRER
jgi:expansin (peptidoglycan-binding protein)